MFNIGDKFIYGHGWYKIEGKTGVYYSVSSDSGSTYKDIDAGTLIGLIKNNDYEYISIKQQNFIKQLKEIL